MRTRLRGRGFGNDREAARAEGRACGMPRRAVREAAALGTRLPNAGPDGLASTTPALSSDARLRSRLLPFDAASAGTVGTHSPTATDWTPCFWSGADACTIPASNSAPPSPAANAKKLHSPKSPAHSRALETPRRTPATVPRCPAHGT